MATNPLEESTSVFDPDATAFDNIITLEDINVKTYLEENTRNVAFKFGVGYAICTKDDIINHCINNENTIIFGCRAVERFALVPRAENVIRDIPYINPSCFGFTFGGLFRLSDIRKILNDPAIQCIEVGDYPIARGVRARDPIPVTRLISVTSLSMLNGNPNALGSLRCLAGQGMPVYSLRKIVVPRAPGMPVYPLRQIVVSPAALIRTNADIKEAVNLWCSNRAEAEERYGHISDWDVSSVTTMFRLFIQKSDFNDDISRWNVSNVTRMEGMFNDATSFNQPIGDWDVSNVTNMAFMFYRASNFNQPIGDWDVSKVTKMENMFNITDEFNQPIGDWNVSSVVTMGHMFGNAYRFNQPIGNWDVSSVGDMSWMFSHASSFNQPIGNWDVSNVTDISRMFYGARAFNQDISRWNVASAVERGAFNEAPKNSMFKECPISNANKPARFQRGGGGAKKTRRARRRASRKRSRKGRRSRNGRRTRR